MKKISTIFLQAVIVLIGIGALAFLIWEPTVEGVNANATTFSQIYLDDPFLACAYLVSIAFFAGLHQAFTLLGYIRQNRIFSQDAVKALRNIKYCAIFLVACLVVAEVWLFIAMRGKDDIAGGVVMGLVLMLVFAVSAAAAAVAERTLRKAVEMKSENELTV